MCLVKNKNLFSLRYLVRCLCKLYAFLLYCVYPCQPNSLTSLSMTSVLLNTKFTAPVALQATKYFMQSILRQQENHFIDFFTAIPQCLKSLLLPYGLSTTQHLVPLCRTLRFKLLHILILMKRLKLHNYPKQQFSIAIQDAIVDRI